MLRLKCITRLLILFHDGKRTSIEKKNECRAKTILLKVHYRVENVTVLITNREQRVFIKDFWKPLGCKRQYSDNNNDNANAIENAVTTLIVNARAMFI